MKPLGISGSGMKFLGSKENVIKYLVDLLEGVEIHLSSFHTKDMYSTQAQDGKGEYIRLSGITEGLRIAHAVVVTSSWTDTEEQVGKMVAVLKRCLPTVGRSIYSKLEDISWWKGGVFYPTAREAREAVNGQLLFLKRVLETIEIYDKTGDS